MIHCLLIRISHTTRGQPVRSYHTLTGDELTLGRATECKMHLPDPRIAMHHATIKRQDDGQMHLIALNGELETDGMLQSSVPLTHGVRVMVGPYQLSVEPAPPDVDLAISLAMVNRLPDDYQDLKSRTEEPLPGALTFKRRLAAWMVGLIVLLFMVLPLAHVFSPQLRDAMSQLPFGFDRVWSPGRISSAHQNIGSQCVKCHQVPGRQISDRACMSCHRDVAPHLTDPALQQRAFERIRHVSGGMRCAECHREHKAPHPLTRQDNATCVKCHGHIRKANPVTKLPDIHDFDRDHPDFKLTFITGPEAGDIQRIAQSDKERLVEHSGLKFPHAQHVGAVQGPGGMSDIRELSCVSCHRPQGKEMRFSPVSFKRDCLSCHADRLEVGPSGATLRVPHGAEQHVMNLLRLQAPRQFERYSETLKTDGCAYCHDMAARQPGDELPWRIMPLRITQDWFSKARFDHGKHRTQSCQSCHAVEESESSADVAIPDRKSCLQCHAGNTPRHKRIASSCMSCHDFHNTHAAQGGAALAGSLDQEDVKRLLSLGRQPEQ